MSIRARKQVKPPDVPDHEGVWAYRTDRLRLRHLRLLKLVDSGGSLGSAARRLGISQPAATLLLRELESVFSAKLVERGARGARLTASGRHALDRLTIALSSVERAIWAARMPAIEPPLRLGCIQVTSVSGLPAAINRLDKVGTLGRLRIQEGRAHDLLAALCAGDLDCVIGWIDESVADGLPIGELQIAPLWFGRMQVVAATSHPLAKLRAVSVAELARWCWIVPPPGSRTHAAYLRLFLRDGIPAPPVTVECSALHTMLHVVSATRLLAVAPDAAVHHYAHLGMLTPLKGPMLKLDRNQVSVVTRRDSDALLAVRELRKALLAQRSARARGSAAP
jgi:molybdate transport repressor ModE-like protein